MMQYSTVVFDMHGVLINSLEMGQQYSQRIAELLEHDYGIPIAEGLERHKTSFQYWIHEFRSWDALSGKTLSRSIDETIRHWAEILVGDRVSDPVVLQRYGEYLEYQAAAHIQALYPEVIPVLDTIRSKKPPLRIYVASSAHTRHVRGLLEANKLMSRVDGFFGLDSFMYPKSSVKYFEMLAQHIGCCAGSSVFVGNSEPEVLLSQKAGFTPVLIQRERKVSQDAIETARIVLSEISGLPEFLSH